MQVASRELCEELCELSGWRETDKVWRLDVYSDGSSNWYIYGYELRDSSDGWVPAYSADYLLEKVRQYDFNIYNLNHKTLSLESDSLDDPEAAILGHSLAEALCLFAIELFKQGILQRGHNE